MSMFNSFFLKIRSPDVPHVSHVENTLPKGFPVPEERVSQASGAEFEVGWPMDGHQIDTLMHLEKGLNLGPCAMKPDGWRCSCLSSLSRIFHIFISKHVVHHTWQDSGRAITLIHELTQDSADFHCDGLLVAPSQDPVFAFTSAGGFTLGLT